MGAHPLLVYKSTFIQQLFVLDPIFAYFTHSQCIQSELLWHAQPHFYVTKWAETYLNIQSFSFLLKDCMIPTIFLPFFAYFTKFFNHLSIFSNYFTQINKQPFMLGCGWGFFFAFYVKVCTVYFIFPSNTTTRVFTIFIFRSTLFVTS